MIGQTCLEIDGSIVQRFPLISVSGISVTGLEGAMAATEREVLDGLWDSARAALSSAGVRLDTIASHPAIQPWRDAVRESGLAPSTVRSSVESLARRVLKHGPIETPVRAVNLYCALSVKHLAPAGGYDVERLPRAQITLRGASPATDSFEPLGGRPEDMPLNPRVVVYAAGATVICWCFNHRDARTTALLPSTGRAVFISEALTAEGRSRSIAMLRELSGFLTERGAVVGEVSALDASNTAGEL